MGTATMTKRIEPTHPVTAGSYWVDAYNPEYGRIVLVVDVDGTHATVMTLANNRCLQSEIDQWDEIARSERPIGNVPRDMRGRTARITLDRFRPIANGFLHLENGPLALANRNELCEGEVQEFRAILNEPEHLRISRHDSNLVTFAHIPEDETFRL
jgi:hypothetical protein